MEKNKKTNDLEIKQKGKKRGRHPRLDLSSVGLFASFWRIYLRVKREYRLQYQSMALLCLLANEAGWISATRACRLIYEHESGLKMRCTYYLLSRMRDKGLVEYSEGRYRITMEGLRALELIE